MTGTLMLSRLVRDDVMKDLVFSGRILPASEGRAASVWYQSISVTPT